MVPVNELSAIEMARRIARRELRVETLVRACLARIEARESIVGAWTFLDPDSALAEARRLDAGALRGPLHGLPLGVKDLIDTVQYPTAYGSPIYAGHRPPWDAACVARARSAGALVLGKTVTTEFAAYHPGKTANPHNPAHTPGGSSSGSAAAVADGMVPLAYGTQTAASVIRPAAFCGVVGFKPGFGLISRAGVKPLAESLDTLGVFARDVADAALFAGVLAGRNWQPPDTPAIPRIGVCRTSAWNQAEPAAQTAFEQAALQLAKHGAQISVVDLPAAFDDLVPAQIGIMAFEASQSLHDEAVRHADRLSAPLQALIAQGQSMPPERYAECQQQARACRGQLDAVFAGTDVLLTLSAPGEAPEGLGATGNPLFSRLWTLLGVPCLHVPCAHGPRGLPLGVQVIGKAGGERQLLEAAQWIFGTLRMR